MNENQSKTNTDTIATYNTHIKAYIDNTPLYVTPLAKDWLDVVAERLEVDARILEVGSGIGHDASYLEGKGLSVERTDAAVGFIRHLKDQGFNARYLDILADDLRADSYDLVLADAVLPHFTENESELVCRKICNSLKSGGMFACSLRIGDREGWSEEKLGAPRYFRYWQRQAFESMLRKVGFSDITATDGEMENSSWLHIIACKVAHEQ